MKLIILAALLTFCMARPDKLPVQEESQEFSQNEIIFEKYVPKIIRSESSMDKDGSYNFLFETEDGIKREEFGSPIPGAENAIGQVGSYSYTLPNGELFELRFVADENGYQPESRFLPVAPEFPHPIPQFVLDQIEKARIEDEEAARKEAEQSEDHSFDDFGLQ